MDPLQRRMAIAGVRPLADDGFALAGGYALRAHGFGQRDSDDIDLFTDVLDPQRFAEAVDRLTGSPSWPRSDPAASGSDGPESAARIALPTIRNQGFTLAGRPRRWTGGCSRSSSPPPPASRTRGTPSKG